MNVSIINKQEKTFQVIPKGNCILECCSVKNFKDIIRLQLFNPARNTLQDIAPDRKIINFVDIINCIWNSSDIYYADCEYADNGLLNIGVYRFPLETGAEIKVCSFMTDRDLLNNDRKIKIFILNESTVLIQEEIHQLMITNEMMGNLKFRLTLYNTETENATAVTEANFLNNGINTIIPVEDNKIMIKTGYSYLEDPRQDSSHVTGAFIESIYITTVTKFIADMTLANDVVDMPLIESAYQDRVITRPRVDGSFIHYCIIDARNNSAKCVFYNYETENRVEYTADGFDADDLYITYVINNTPYVRKASKDTVSFMNLNKAETDISFYDEKFLAQTGLLFIMQSEDRSGSLCVYAYPKLRMILREKQRYVASCHIGDNYYIYTV